MTPTSTPTAIDNYFTCWNEPDDARRLGLIETTWAPNARSVDPLEHRFQLVGEPAAHHDVLRWCWALVEVGGSAVIGGIDVAHVAADGRITDLTGFFDGDPS